MTSGVLPRNYEPEGAGTGQDALLRPRPTILSSSCCSSGERPRSATSRSSISKEPSDPRKPFTRAAAVEAIRSLVEG